MPDPNELDVAMPGNIAHAKGDGPDASMEVARRYFDAWNRHDAASLAALFAAGGTYSDPATGGPLMGEAIGAYAGGLWGAFPDLAFDLLSAAPTTDGLIAAQWVMRGTNHGPMMGLPPSGNAISLPGADFIAVEENAIHSVQGYFDQRAFLEQLGLQVVVQPRQVGPYTFGTTARVHSGKSVQPGAFSITNINVNSAEEAEYVSKQSRQIALEMLGMRGFISWIGVVIGNRLSTITAWENPGDSRQLAENGIHRESVKKHFGPEFATGGMISTWTPEHLSVTIRCPECGRMGRYEPSEGICTCGAQLPEPRDYW